MFKIVLTKTLPYTLALLTSSQATDFKQNYINLMTSQMRDLSIQHGWLPNTGTNNQEEGSDEGSDTLLKKLTKALREKGLISEDPEYQRPRFEYISPSYSPYEYSDSEDYDHSGYTSPIYSPRYITPPYSPRIYDGNNERSYGISRPGSLTLIVPDSLEAISCASAILNTEELVQSLNQVVAKNELI